jgi:hypothetical protein
MSRPHPHLHPPLLHPTTGWAQVAVDFAAGSLTLAGSLLVGGTPSAMAVAHLPEL